MADYQPVYAPAAAWTATASATITGGQLLENTGDGTVGPAGATSVKVVGVAAHDAASGAKVTVHSVAGVVHETTAGTGGVAAGVAVVAAASGAIITNAAPTPLNAIVGVALTTATVGNKARWVGR